MKVVADTSVLIGLSAIRKLNLVRERFPQGILIPQAVWREVVEEGENRPGAQEVASADWIDVRQVTKHGIKQLLLTEIDEGEAEAIALAHEIQADLLLIDERDARQAAKRVGLRTLGTVGILIWAKRTGRLSSLKMMLDLLQTVGKFRISHNLYARALRDANEQVE